MPLNSDKSGTRTRWPRGRRLLQPIAELLFNVFYSLENHSVMMFRSATTFTVLSLGTLLLAIAGCSGSNSLLRVYQADPSVVAVITDQPLTLDEFERQYSKTVGGRDVAEEDSLADYQDFLERWVDFRLKVRMARDAGLHRDSALVSELSSYREQFARPFLLDKEVTDPLIRDLYDRQQKMVDVSHILIRVDPKASPADTIRAFRKLEAIRDSILAGADFGDTALKYSEDPSAASASAGPGYRGRLGFVRGGRLVPEFETVAFRMPIGEVSSVFRTQFGYHILVVHAREAAAPDVRISHIMVTPKSAADSVDAWAKIRAIHDSLAAGVPFADLARRNSDDAGTAQNGGDLGYVAIDGRLVPTIKDAAFALTDIGDRTEPIESVFGLHIVELTDRRQPQSLEEMYDDLRRRISRSPQLTDRQNSFARGILVDAGFSVDSAMVFGFFGEVSADSASQIAANGIMKVPSTVSEVASIGTRTYSADEFAAWAQNSPVKTYTDLPDFVNQLIDAFLLDKAIEYKMSRLEDDNAEFRETMADFIDGLLLFRVMDDSVWTRAAEDSTELRRRYDLGPARFTFPDRHRIVGLYSRRKAAADSAARMLEAGASLAEVVAALPDTSDLRIRVDTTYVAGVTNSVFDAALKIEDGTHTAPQAYNRGYIVLVRSGIEPSRVKTFEEARTELVNEYQQELEDRLVARLRTRYGARTFPEKLTLAFQPRPETVAARP